MTGTPEVNPVIDPEIPAAVMPDKGSKLAVIGAGAVGSACVYASMIKGVAREYALFDINESKVKAEALDIAQGSQFAPVSTVEGSSDMAVIKDADVVVITAGAKQKPGQSRLDLAGATINIMKDVIPKAVEQAPNAIFLLVSNPVDVVTYAGLKDFRHDSGSLLWIGHGFGFLAPSLPDCATLRRFRTDSPRIHRW